MYEGEAVGSDDAERDGLVDEAKEGTADMTNVGRFDACVVGTDVGLETGGIVGN